MHDTNNTTGRNEKLEQKINKNERRRCVIIKT